MLSIQIATKKNSSRARGEEDYLVVNGEPILQSWALNFGKQKSGGIYDTETAEHVLSFPMRELFANLNQFQAPYGVDWNEDLNGLEFSDGARSQDFPTLRFKFHFELELWARPWTILQFAEAVQDVVKARDVRGLTTFRDDEEFVSHGFGFACQIEDQEVTGLQEISKWASILREIGEEVEFQLLQGSRDGVLTRVFRFPEEIAAPCEQYLVYFAQFLADLGLEAIVDVAHEASYTLFSVQPRSSREALEQIRSALDAYLEMPADPRFRLAAQASSDVAVLQLRANVMHLESQLALADAMLQAKNATIEALQLTKFQLERKGTPILPVSTSPSSEVNISKDTEKIIDGVLSVQNTQLKGFVIHWPEIIRRLKRRSRSGISE